MYSLQASAGAVEDLTIPTPTRTLNVYYGTQTGTAKEFAKQLAIVAKDSGVKAAVFDLKECDPEDTLTQEVRVVKVADLWVHDLLLVVKGHFHNSFGGHMYI